MELPFFFSVVIPLYNKEKNILKTVTSVLDQSFSNFELLIVDDGSTDSSVEVISMVDDERIRLIKKTNGGVSSARNRGMDEAKSEYIAFLDGDDIWGPNHLELLYKEILLSDDKDIGGFGTSFYKSTLENFDSLLFKQSQGVKVSDYYEFMSSPQPKFNSSTLIVKKSKVLITGYFDENIRYGEDVEFWYRLFSRFSLIFVNSVTTLYYVAAENRSNHYVMPLKFRFHVFDYRKKSLSERKYLDKLVALLIIDYAAKGSITNVLKILRMYYLRIPGSLRYMAALGRKKFR